MFEHWLMWVLLIIIAGALSWFAWVSVQSLLQARLLYRTRTLSAHLPDQPGPAAVHGTVRIERGIRANGMERCLWYRRVEQTYRRRGKSRSWVTQSDRTELADFAVEAGGRAFRIEEMPSEVQATEETTEYHHDRLLGIFHSTGDCRTLHYWLHAPSRVTVVGRFEPRGETLVLVKDNKVGLLLSPLEPSRAARRELFKGLAGLLGVTALVVAGLYCYYSMR